MPVDIATLQASIPNPGVLRMILLRPGHREVPASVERAAAIVDRGLEGDRRAARVPRLGPSKRQVTLIMEEHLGVVADLLGSSAIDPTIVRRNLVVSGINLSACRDRDLSIGDVVLHVTGHCHPCSRMEENLGPGGYQAMRGHGGVTATVVVGGELRVSDPVGLAAS